MEILHETPILKFYPDTLNSVRALYGLEAPGRVDDAVNILVEWVTKQDHFIKKDFNREYLERLIIHSKGSVEKAKRKIDKMCTFRTILPNFFERVDIRKSSIPDYSISGIIPKLTEDHNRIFVAKIKVKNHTSGFSDFYKYIAMVGEYLQTHEYCNRFISVLDYLDSDMMNIIKNIDINELREGISILMEGYGVRMKAIHIVATSNAVDIILMVIKQVLSKKLIDRIHLHKTIDTLREHIPKDLLPKEYGGCGDTLKNICDNTIDELTSDEFTECYKDMCSARTDEALRSQELFNEQYMGMPGSFRKLCVD